LEVKVLWGTRLWGPRATRKAPTAREVLKEAGERNREPTNRKRPFQASGVRRIQGDGDQGERPNAREALTAKGQPAYIRRLRGESHEALTWGDLALRPKGRRRSEGGARSQQKP
jgi:hypothetical protein